MPPPTLNFLVSCETKINGRKATVRFPLPIKIWNKKKFGLLGTVVKQQFNNDPHDLGGYTILWAGDTLPGPLLAQELRDKREALPERVWFLYRTNLILNTKFPLRARVVSCVRDSRGDFRPLEEE